MAAGSLTKNTKVNVSGFQVDENVIYYGNSAINTNNISLITISPIPANNSWIIAILFALAGLITRFKDGGWILLLIAIAWIIGVVIYNKNRGENLAISLNSGNTLYFNCKEREFLNRVISLMVECIKSGSGHYSISFDKCVINNDRGKMGNIRIG